MNLWCFFSVTGAVNDYIFVENDTNCSLIVDCMSFTSYTISVTQRGAQTTTTDMLCATGFNSTTVLADPEGSTTYDYQVQVESVADTVIVMGSFEDSKCFTARIYVKKQLRPEGVHMLVTLRYL